MKLRMAALFLSIILLMCWGFSAQASMLSKEELYKASLNELKAYLDGDTTTPLNALIENFDGLGRYKMSIDLSFYALVLRDVELNDFDDVALYISMLKLDPDLPAFLEEHQMGSLEELENYALARECQRRGKYAEAVEYYSRCMGFMDSMIRYRQLRPGVDEEMSRVTPSPTPKKYYNNTSSKRTTPKPTSTPKPVATPRPTATPKPAATPCPHTSTREVAGEREYGFNGDSRSWLQKVEEICNTCGTVVNSWYNGGSYENIVIPSNPNSWEYDDDGEAAKPVESGDVYYDDDGEAAKPID